MFRVHKRLIKDSLLLLLVIAVFLLYMIFNVSHGSVYVIKTFMDDLIPRLPVFAPIYLAYFPFLWGTIFYAWYKDRSFRRLAWSIIIVNVVCFAIYFFFQTHIPRLPVIENDIFSNLLKFIYSNDQPFAGCPSTHAALSTVVATYFACVKSRYKWAAIVIAFLIIGSTLFTKQHFLIDAISGILLGLIATLLVFKFYKKDNWSISSIGFII